MNSSLNAIYTELLRLRSEGIDRIFVNDDSLRLVQRTNETPLKATTSEISHIDLKTEFKRPAARESTHSPSKSISKLPEPPVLNIPAGSPTEQLSWLAKTTAECKVCSENLTDGHTPLLGAGSETADLLFCGEAPGPEEMESQIPFSGPSGELLEKILKAMELNRDKVYLTYILKWHPKNSLSAGNRPPTAEEIKYCIPFFNAEVTAIRPKVIIALGNIAANGLLAPDGKGTNFGQIRGAWQDFNGTPLIATFHPSYLLRNNTLKTKRMFWEDMLKVMEKVTLPISPKQQQFFIPKN